MGQPALVKTDSIYRYALSHPGDSATLHRLNAQLISIYSDNSDTAIYYAKKQLSMAREGGWRNLEGMGLIMIGVSLEISGELDSAIHYYKSARTLGTAIEDSTVLVASHNSLGRVYSRKGMYQLSIEETLKAVELVSESTNQKQNASILNSVGMRFNELNRNAQAASFFRRSLELNEHIQDTTQIIINCSNLGKTYLSLQKLDSSLYFYRKALKLSSLKANRYQNMIAYSGLALNYLERDQLDSAQWAKDSSETIAFIVNDAFRIHQADVTQAKILLKKGEYREAIAHLEEALAWFNEENYVSTSIDILESLSIAWDMAGEDGKALLYLKRMNALKDRVYLEQRERAMEQVDIYRQQRQDKERALLDQQLEHQTGLRNLFFLLGVLMLILMAVGLNRYLFERKTKKLLAEKNALIEFEKGRSDKLLLNILPDDVAEELKETGRSNARHFDQVTVLFTDFVSFTDISANLTAQELVEEIDHCFRAFDEIMNRYDIEKIKTIGDAYMAAGDLQDDEVVNPLSVVMAALEMQEFMTNYANELKDSGRKGFEMRVGLHTGPVVAGIVGMTKFQYDIWGDTVNTAARMESHGGAGKVNISNYTYEMLKNEPSLAFESRGMLAVKGKGEMEMHFVTLKA